MKIRLQPLLLLLILFLIFIRTSLPQEKKSGRNTLSLSDTALANEYFQKGDSLSNAAQYDSSDFYFEKAKEIYSQLSNIYDDEGIWMRLIRCANKIGLNLILQGKYESSLEQFEPSLELAKEKLGGNNVEVVQCYDNVGRANSYKGDYDKALDYYQKSLQIKLRLLGKNHPDVAGSYSKIGAMHDYKGDYSRALEYYQKSLSIRLPVLGEEHSEVANTYNNIGIIYGDKGDYDKALEYHQRSLSIWLSQLGENHLYIAMSYNNIGTLYSDKGDYDKALEYHQKSLSVRMRILDKDHPGVAFSYSNIGDTYYRKGDLDKALEYYQRSLSIMQHELDMNHFLVTQDNEIVAKNYENIGKVHSDKGYYDPAMEYLRKSLSLRLRIFGEKNPGVALSYRHIAEVYYKKKDFTSALSNCQKSIITLVPRFNDQSAYSNPPLEGIGSELNLLAALELKAKIFLQMSEHSGLKDLEMALSTYHLAVELIDKMRVGYKSEGSKLFLGEKVSGVYDKAIQTSLKLYDATKDEQYKHQAFLFVEKSKAAVLRGQIAEVQARQFAKLPSELLEEERQLKIDLAFYESQLQKEYQDKASQDSIKINNYENSLFNLKARYEKLISDFEENYPDYYDLKYLIKTVSVYEIQNQLPGNTALIEYFIGDSSIFVFTILKNEFDIVSIRKPDNFSELIKDFYSSILKTETEKYIRSANSLSELLIIPILEKIGVNKKLIIIPHDLLFKLPFEALFTLLQSQEQRNYSNINYLIKTFDVSYNYSSTLYLSTRKDTLDKLAGTNLNNDRKNFIGFAPVFAENDSKGYTIASRDLKNIYPDLEDEFRSSMLDGDKYKELKYSEWEVKSIIELFASQPRRNLINQVPTSFAYFHSDATEEAFKSNVNNYNIVHIASHSFMNETHPEISGVVFAQPSSNLTFLPDEQVNQVSADDGILYAAETYNLDLNADLVVLSSCESGLGKLIRGEGLMALTRGFLYSGADNIIFSLWKIPDKHTSELMIGFYKQILSGKSYSESLRKAKLTLIENEYTARPRSWASFILIGH